MRNANTNYGTFLVASSENVITKSLLKLFGVFFVISFFVTVDCGGNAQLVQVNENHE